TKAESDWEIGKDLLESRIDLLRGQIDELEEKTKAQSESITETDKSRAKLVEENESLDEVVEVQYERVERFEERVRQLFPILPAELKEKVEPIFDRLPKPGKAREEINSSISERYVNVLGILKAMDDFDNAITLTVESREMSDGKTANVDTLYFGFSRAVYVGTGDRANEAGFGIPGAEGWTWTAAPEQAKAIGSVIRMYRGEEDAAFVPLPFSVQ
ncbi:MAG: DUF3450 family protein, partial [Verrucomicrobiota bacterium]